MHAASFGFGIFVGCAALTLLIWLARGRGWLGTSPDSLFAWLVWLTLVVAAVAPVLGIAGALIVWLAT